MISASIIVHFCWEEILSLKFSIRIKAASSPVDIVDWMARNKARESGESIMAKIMEVPEGIDKLEVRKKLNKMISSARKKAKPAVCALCGNSKTSFCNSHSVPQMSLRAIADGGIVLHASVTLGFDKEIIDIENGVNKSGTFNFICNDCDGTFFQDYENQDNLVQYPTDKVLAEIAVKNFLLQLSKRNVEIELWNIMQQERNAFSNLDEGMNAKKIDISELQSELKFHKNIADNNKSGGYQVMVWKVLPYVVPIAMQSAIAVTKDMEGNEINDIYIQDADIRMQYLHLAILPLDSVSVVIAFYHKRDKLYRKLRHQINSISEDEVLKYINYLVFKYTENYYIAKAIEDEVVSNENLQRLSQESDCFPTLGILGIENLFGIGYEQVAIDKIPNFLALEWALKASNNADLFDDQKVKRIK